MILQIPLNDVEEGRPVIKVVGKTAVGVLKVGDRIYAFDPFCPHSKWNLGASGRLARTNGRLYIFCKGHGGLWCLETGEGKVQGKEAPPLKLYRTWISDGVIYIELDSQRIL